VRYLDAVAVDKVRRVRAARGSLNFSLDQFAEAIGIGRQTLVRIENGTRDPKPHEYTAMAEATGLPVEFFTAPDLHAALSGAGDRPTLAERVADLERGRDEIVRALQQLRDDIIQLPAVDGDADQAQVAHAFRGFVERARHLAGPASHQGPPPAAAETTQARLQAG
jgi:transcriptional regulator with XRE-family HTH domain